MSGLSAVYDKFWLGGEWCSVEITVDQREPHFYVEFTLAVIWEMKGNTGYFVS